MYMATGREGVRGNGHTMPADVLHIAFPINNLSCSFLEKKGKKKVGDVLVDYCH